MGEIGELVECEWKIGIMADIMYFSSFFPSCSSLDYEGVVKLSEDFNGADLRNVCTEAGKTDRAFLTWLSCDQILKECMPYVPSVTTS